MKKLLSIIISSVVVVALAIGLIFLIININNEKEYSLTVGASVGGNVQLIVDDTVYDISSNRSKSYVVKKKSKISITALPTIGYEFSGWEINGEEKGENEKIEIEISSETDVYANFILSNIDLTVVDGEFNETFEYSPASNLLSALQSKYTADNGYKYVYKVGNETINENTIITKATTITREKVEIKYSVIFKNGDDQVGETQYYTISTKDNIVVPNIPTFENDEHYKDIEWDTLDLSTLGNKVVKLNKTAIEYTIEFKHNGEVVDTKTYTIENSKVEGPTIDDISSQDYYTYAWPEYTLTYNVETLVVETIVTPIVNTITYKNSTGATVATISYTKDEFETAGAETFVEPELIETIDHYTLAWSTNLADIVEGEVETYCGKQSSVNTEITTIKTPIDYTVTFKVNGEEIESEDNVFNAEDYTISVPNINNNNTGIFYKFALPTLTKDDLGRNDIVINAETYVKISFKRTLNESVTLDTNKYIFIKIVDGAIQLNENGEVVLYNIPNSTKEPTAVENATYLTELGTYTNYTPKFVNDNICTSKTISAVINEVLKLQTGPATITIDFKI